MQLVLCATALFAAVQCVVALPSGAPSIACESLSPQHGAEAQTSSPPYAIMLSTTKIEKGCSVDVVMVGINDVKFRGFVFQARQSPEEPEPLGFFSIDEPNRLVRLTNCTNDEDTITHRTRNETADVSFIWTAPPDFEGTVVITGTVVQSKEVFWTKLVSSPIEIGDASPTTHEPEITSSTTESSNDSSFYTECGLTKSCLGYPRKCIEKKSCNFAMSVMRKTNHYLFEFVSYQVDTAKYVAVALANQSKMSEAVVMECVKENGRAKAYTSWMSGRTVSRNKVFQSTIKQTGQKVSQNYFFCEIERPIETEVNGQTINLDESKFNILLASGNDASNTGIGYHDNEKMSTSKESLAAIKIYEEPSKVPYQIHGILMLIAWIGTTSIGIVCAAYFRSLFSSKQLFGKELWFIIHLTCMSITWTLTIVAFILIFVTVGGWSGTTNPHSIFGITTIILCFLQPIGAYFRPHPKDETRPFFNFVHSSAGHFAHSFAVLTMLYSVSLTKIQLPLSTYYLLGCYAVYYLLVHFMLMSIQKRDYNFSIKMRQTMFVLHVFAICAFTVSGIVFITLPTF